MCFGSRCLRFTYSENAGERIGRECHQCLAGAFCGGGNLVAPLKGFWRNFNSNRSLGNSNRSLGAANEYWQDLAGKNFSKKLTFLPCREPSACVGAQDFGLNADPNSKNFYSRLLVPTTRNADPYLEIDAKKSQNTVLGNVRPGMQLNFAEGLVSSMLFS